MNSSVAEYVTISIPVDLATEMDKIVGKHGFTSRAEIAKAAIRDFLRHQEGNQ